jgi:hypothetical protein
LAAIVGAGIATACTLHTSDKEQRSTDPDAGCGGSNHYPDAGVILVPDATVDGGPYYPDAAIIYDGGGCAPCVPDASVFP